MAKLILASHGDFCTGACSALKMFAGDSIDVVTVSLGDDGVGPFRDQLRAAVESADEDLIIVTDLAGGTPCNEATALGLADPQRIRVVAGMNLPMLVELTVALMIGAPTDVAISKGVEAGRAGVHPIDLIVQDDEQDEDGLF